MNRLNILPCFETKKIDLKGWNSVFEKFKSNENSFARLKLRLEGLHDRLKTNPCKHYIVFEFSFFEIAALFMVFLQHSF